MKPTARVFFCYAVAVLLAACSHASLTGQHDGIDQAAAITTLTLPHARSKTFSRSWISTNLTRTRWHRPRHARRRSPLPVTIRVYSPRFITSAAERRG
jgi:hypothetical protein